MIQRLDLIISASFHPGSARNTRPSRPARPSARSAGRWSVRSFRGQCRAAIRASAAAGASVVSASTCSSLSAWLEVSPPAMTARVKFFALRRGGAGCAERPSEPMTGAGNAIDLATTIGRRAKRRVEDDAAARLQAVDAGIGRIFHRAVRRFRRRSSSGSRSMPSKPFGHGLADLPFGGRRDAAGNDGEAVDLARQGKVRRSPIKPFVAPGGEQRIFDAGGAGDEPAVCRCRSRQSWRPAAAWLSALSTSISTMPAASPTQFVDPARPHPQRAGSRDRRALTGSAVCLAEVQAQIGFVHRRHRMAAHHRMAVDAIDLALIGGEEMAEGGVAFQLRRADDDRHAGLLETAPCRFRSPCRYCRSRAGIEGRADLVVADRRRRGSSATRRPASDAHPSIPASRCGWCRQGRWRGNG